MVNEIRSEFDPPGFHMKNLPAQFLFWRRWLAIITVGVMLFGASMVVVPGFIRQMFGLLLYASPNRLDAFDPAALAYITLLHGVLGSVMFGWGTAMLLIVLGPFRNPSRQAWLTLAVSLAAWFIPDTAFSLWSGFWQNGALNLGLAILFAIPLAATYRLTNDPHNRPARI
jgi:hypothetical protein